MTDEFGAFNPFEEVEETSNNEGVSDEDTSEKNRLPKQKCLKLKTKKVLLNRKTKPV